MSDLLVRWDVVAPILAVVVLAAFLLGRRTGGGARRVRELEAELARTAEARDAAQQELDGYRRRVTDHFTETSHRLHDLTLQYRAVYDHLAKGASERRVILKHALKNAMIPIITVIGLSIAMLVAGAVVTETVFGLPGVGNLVVSAVLRRDYPVIQGTLLVVAAIYVLINFIVDMLYILVDPRVRRRLSEGAIRSSRRHSMEELGRSYESVIRGAIAARKAT